MKTEEEILSLIAQHVKAVNRIYSDTSFDGKYKHNGYQFEVSGSFRDEQTLFSDAELFDVTWNCYW